MYTNTSALFISELFLIHANHSDIKMDYRLFLFYRGLTAAAADALDVSVRMTISG